MKQVEIFNKVISTELRSKLSSSILLPLERIKFYDDKIKLSRNNFIKFIELKSAIGTKIYGLVKLSSPENILCIGKLLSMKNDNEVYKLAGTVLRLLLKQSVSPVAKTSNNEYGYELIIKVPVKYRLQEDKRLVVKDSMPLESFNKLHELGYVKRDLNKFGAFKVSVTKEKQKIKSRNRAKNRAYDAKHNAVQGIKGSDISNLKHFK